MRTAGKTWQRRRRPSASPTWACQLGRCASSAERVDEPTTGLHPADIDRLLGIVDRLIAGGNTVVVIEHNLDVIAAADWIVDLGSEGGKDGAIVAERTPETIAAHHATSHTGRYLKKRLAVTSQIEPSPRRRRPSGYPGGDDRATATSSGADSGPVAPRMRGVRGEPHASHMETGPSFFDGDANVLKWLPGERSEIPSFCHIDR